MASQQFIHRCNRALPWVAGWFVVLLLVHGFQASWLWGQSEKASPAQSAPPPTLLIDVPLPLVGTADTQIKRRIEQLLSEQTVPEPRPLVILQFSPNDAAASQRSEFERCLSLARFLSGERLTGARTVAFVTGHLDGHSVLPVLACEQLIVHPEAVIGDAGVAESYIDPTMRSSYADIAERRGPFRAAIAVGMLDRQARLLKVETGAGIEYALPEDLDELKQSTNINKVDPLFAEGEMARFTGRDLRLTYGIASFEARDLSQLAHVLQIPISSLQDKPLLEGPRVALQVDIARPISGKLVNWIITSMNQQLAKQQFNFVCINLESAGGSVNDSLRLANYLAALQDQNLQTVAFVREEARADAALIALACDELVIGRDAVLGGPGAVVIRAGGQDDLRRSIRALAESRRRDWSLPAALVDSNLVVHRYIREGTNEVRYFCQDELAAQETPQEWKQDAEILARNGISGSEAVEIQLASQTAESVNELVGLYALESELQMVQPNWANLLIEKLASPHLAGTLLFIGLLMFMIEMSQPGIGVAGFVSATCFVLFFWSHALHGTAGWLEVMLFLTGVGCLVLEIFVIPGFGIFGIGGSAMVIGSIVLASQTFVIPQNKYQIEQLPQSLFVLVAAGSGAFLSVFLLRKYLPDTPVLRHMLLAPPEDEELEELQQREAVVHCEHLAGKRGTTTTRLNPAGKARFGDEVVDVIGEGELIDQGTPVYVTSVRGNKIVVVPISSPADARPV